MDVILSDLVAKVRIALDEIGTDVDDDFFKDADTEIQQAIEYAVLQLCKELPEGMLEPTSLSGDLTAAQVKDTDGSGYIVLPPDYLRLVEFRLWSWSGSVREVLDPTSDEAKRQSNRWSRGTPQKPRALESTDKAGNKILRYWTAGMFATNDTKPPKVFYDHRVELLTYVPRATVSSDGKVLSCPLKDETLQDIVYRAAGIFLEGKKEGALADRFYALSKA